MCLNESIHETVAKLTSSHTLATWQNLYPHPETCTRTQHSLKCALAVVFRSSADYMCTYWLGLNWIRQSWHNLTPSSEVIIMIHFTAQQVIQHPKLSQLPRKRHIHKKRLSQSLVRKVDTVCALGFSLSYLFNQVHRTIGLGLMEFILNSLKSQYSLRNTECCNIGLYIDQAPNLC